MPEAIALTLTEAEPVVLELNDPEEIQLVLTEESIVLEVIGETGPPGIQGGAGDAATLDVGTVLTGSPGSDVSVVNVGDIHAAILDITIPRGDVGAQGIQGIQGPAGLDTGFYRHTQFAPSTAWSIQHDLGFYPAVSVQDSAGSTVFGDVVYIDANNVLINFAVAFGGFANLS